MRLAFLASNNGSSLRAIVAAIEAGTLAATPVLVVSNRPGAPALAFARARGIPALRLPTTADPAGADARLADALRAAGAELVILSGYLRRLGPVTLEAFAGRILNIHPALLPKFGGQGMYGRRVHEAVIAAGEGESGASVHLVDGEYDHGPVLAQARLAVAPDDTPETLERRVMALEPVLFVDTLRRILSGDLALAPKARWLSVGGGCLCGGVRFAYQGPFGGALGQVTVCHCASCRRAQGYAAAVAPIQAEGFAVTAGEDLIREFESSPGKFRAFCGTCGAPLYSRLEARPDRLRLRLGALDDPPEDLVIEAHKFTAGAPAWSRPNDAPRHPGQEPG